MSLLKSLVRLLSFLILVKVEQFGDFGLELSVIGALAPSSNPVVLGNFANPIIIRVSHGRGSNFRGSLGDDTCLPHWVWLEVWTLEVE